MKKQILAVVLASVVFIVGLSGCQSGDAASSGTTPAPSGAPAASTTAPSSTDPIVVKFAWGNARTDTPAAGIIAMQKHIEEASGGAMKMEVYWDNTFCESTQILPQMTKGNLEMGGTGATYIVEYMPELGFLNMGYLYENMEHADKVLNGEIGKQIFQRVGEKTGQLPLGAYYFGAREVCLTKDREIKTPADLSDIKMRTNGTESMMFLVSSMGANPVGISYSEMYTALETGVVDGQENPITTVVAQKLYEVSKSLTYTNHMIDFSWIGIGHEFWKTLTPEQQKIIQDGVDIAVKTNTEATVKAEAEAEEFLTSQGLKVYHSDTTAIREAVLAAYDKKATADGWDTELMQMVLDAAS